MSAEIRNTFVNTLVAEGKKNGILTPALEKQKFAEGLMWLIAFQVNDLEQAKQGAKGYTLENVKESVKTTLKSFKIDLDSVRIGAKGLEARD